MDDEFDLYGDADIYGSGDAAPKEEDSKGDYQPEAANAKSSGADANGDAAAGNKRSREDDYSNDVKPQQQQQQQQAPASGSSAQYGADAMRGAQMQQDAPRPLDEPIDPASARIALAGRPKVTDPNVQNALYVGELDWWVSDEDIRRIANDIGIPIALSDVTFSEHKVNGKSKGVCFVETASEDEANALKQWFENNDLNYKRASCNLSTSANGNPFKTLPKDPPPREARAPRGTMRGAMAMGARENNRGGGNMGGYGQGQQAFPMAGAPIRMGAGAGGAAGGNAGGMPMMNPMMMGMMGAAGGRGGFGNPMGFMGGGGGGAGRGGGWGGRGRGQGHFNPNFYGGGMGGGRGGGNGGPPGGNDDRERKRYRTDDGGY